MFVSFLHFYFTGLHAIEINHYHLCSVKIQKMSETILLIILRFVYTLHSKIFQTQFLGKEISYYWQLFLILEVAKFNRRKANFG